MWICVCFPNKSPMLALFRKTLPWDSSTGFSLLASSNKPLITLLSPSCLHLVTPTAKSYHPGLPQTTRLFILVPIYLHKDSGVTTPILFSDSVCLLSPIPETRSEFPMALRKLRLQEPWCPCVLSKVGLLLQGKRKKEVMPTGCWRALNKSICIA